MHALISRRILLLLPTLIGASVLVFVLIRLPPGDTATAMAGPDATQVEIDAVRRHYRLDEPIPVQYLTWAGRVLQADLGVSFTSSLPVTERVLRGLQNTVILLSAASVVAATFGIVSGVLAGVYRGRSIDKVVTVGTLFVVAMPSFWMALMVVLIFGVKLGWLPFVGMYSARNGGGLLDLASHLFLPAMVLGLNMGAIHARIMRASVAEVMSLHYITTARAKGLPFWRGVVKGHALPNAMVPYLSQFGLSIGAGLAGSIIIENVFSWPGLGTVMVQALQAQDYPTIQGAFLLIVLLMLCVNLVVDIVLSLRVRTASFL